MRVNTTASIRERIPMVPMNGFKPFEIDQFSPSTRTICCFEVLSASALFAGSRVRIWPQPHVGTRRWSVVTISTSWKDPLITKPSAYFIPYRDQPADPETAGQLVQTAACFARTNRLTKVCSNATSSALHFRSRGGTRPGVHCLRKAIAGPPLHSGP